MSEYMSAAEKRFYSSARRLRQANLNKDEQIEASYLIKEVQDYGLKFFPNHYLWTVLGQLDKLIANHIRIDNRIGF